MRVSIFISPRDTSVTTTSLSDTIVQTFMRSGAELICLYGPTASGKSALGLEVAKKVNGCIINADSMQVYANLRIITARPNLEEEAQVPHRLYGYIDGALNYNMAIWAEHCVKEIAAVCAVGQVPILVGGTGLYYKTLFEGLSQIPPIPDEIRTKWREIAAQRPPEFLHSSLYIEDPETAAMLKPTDTQRLTRALEVVEATGLGLAAWNRLPQTPFYGRDNAVCFALQPEREWLYERINARFDTMMEQGALEEVRGLMNRIPSLRGGNEVNDAAIQNDSVKTGLLRHYIPRNDEAEICPTMPVMRAHGVPEFIAHFRGEMDYDAALTQAKANVRHYAKRQTTWVRGQLQGWNVLEIGENPSSYPLWGGST